MYSFVFHSSMLVLFLLDITIYIIGITNKVSNNEKHKPPTTTIPNGIRLVEPAPKANAIGNAPKIVANEVIKIGRKRAAADSNAATRLFMPNFRF